MKIGSKSNLPRVFISWPNKVSIGSNCKLEHNIHFKFDGIWSEGQAIIIGDSVFIGNNSEFNIQDYIKVGDDCLIASGCKFIDHDHGFSLSDLMRNQVGICKPIIIGQNVWLGCNVVILKGVNIGDGAIIAAGAVVTKSVGPNEIWGGIPARKIGFRN